MCVTLAAQGRCMYPDSPEANLLEFLLRWLIGCQQRDYYYILPMRRRQRPGNPHLFTDMGSATIDDIYWQKHCGRCWIHTAPRPQ